MIDIAPHNEMLRSLAPEDLATLRPHLEMVTLRLAGVIYEMDDPARWVYFPEAGLLSLITVMISGDAIETSIVGREGAVGFIEALGSGVMFSRVMVQIPGRALRVDARHYREAFDGSRALRRAIHIRTELLNAESRQAIACHGLHKIGPRFNRWLLECQDLAGGPSILPLRQDFLAVMLGVTRPSVSQVANAAQKLGLIKYARGLVEILDREGLERGACECRASVQRLRQRLEPGSPLVRAALSDNPGRTNRA
jgi:CRP-like cAMP-binding protein